MRALLKSCGRWSLFYLALAVLLSAAVYSRFPNIAVAIPIGFVAAVLLWFSLGYWAGVSGKRAERTMIRRAVEGERPEDGERIAVVGRITAVDALQSPITKKRCVAYQYKIGTLDSDGDMWPVYEGFALSPSRIDGPRGSIRLLAWPDLSVGDEDAGDMAHYDNARQYIESTTFDVREGIAIGREMQQVKELRADDDGRIRFDIRRKTPPDNLVNLVLQERVLAPGDEVCAIGRYSESRGALVPDENALLEPVKITRGTREELSRKAGGGGALETILGCGCLVPVIIAAIAGLVLFPLDAIEQMTHEEPSWRQVRIERFVQRRLRPPLAHLIDLPNAALMLEQGAARGRLTAGDETIELRRAAAQRTGDVTDVWITDGATPEHGVRIRIRGRDTVDSLQVIGGPEIEHPDVDTDQLAAYKDEVQGRITYLDGPMLRVAFRAAW